MRISPLRLFALLVLGVLWLGGTAVAQTQEAKLTASDAADGDEFGRAVSFSADGSLALVGARENEVGDDDTGSAYVFTKDGTGTWTQQAKLFASDGEEGDQFGHAVSVSDDGSVALIGALGYDVSIDGSDEEVGAAYIFMRDESGSWVEEAIIPAPNPEQNDEFGNAVSISGDGTTALVGNWEDGTGTNQSGSAYVFTDDGTGTWSQQARLLSSDGAVGDQFGSAVSISSNGSVALIGAREDEVQGESTQGSAYIFTADGSGTWAQQSKLTASDGTSFEYFGEAVSLSGDGSTALIGTPEADVDGNSSQGRAYVFSNASGSWAQQAQLTASDGIAFAEFGGSASINGDGSIALISAPFDNLGDDFGQQGSAYVFSNASGSWTEQAKLSADDAAEYDEFGNALAVSADGTGALIGAPFDEVGGEKYGSAYVFGMLTGAAPTVTTEPATNITETTAQLNGTVNPNGAETTVDFVYYPTGQPGQGQTITADQSPLTGTTEQDVSATATSLQGDTEYTFLVSAENSEGLTNGAEVTFTTGGGTDPVTIAVTETIGVSDEAAVTPPVTISITETVNVSDAPDVTPPVAISITETIGVSDAPGVSPVIAISTSTVGSNGPVDFSPTGVTIDFAGVGGSGEVAVTKYGDPPSGTEGISQPNVSTYRYVIEAGDNLSIGADTDVRLDASTLGGVDDVNAVTIYKRPTPGTGSFSALATSYDASTNEFVATTGGFSEFVLASDENPLPVELTDFKARGAEASVHLRWRTASETDNAGFEIERTYGQANAWTQIGFVEGHGTTSEPHTYSFEDSTPPFEADSLRYRLKQIDLGGAFEYSDAVEVAIGAPDKLALHGNFPNPFTRQTTIRYEVPQNGNVRLAVYDVLGQRVALLANEPQEAGRKEVTFTAHDLSSGVYFVRLTSGGTTRTQKITVVR